MVDSLRTSRGARAGQPELHQDRGPIRRLRSRFAQASARRSFARALMLVQSTVLLTTLPSFAAGKAERAATATRTASASSTSGLPPISRFAARRARRSLG